MKSLSNDGDEHRALNVRDTAESDDLGALLLGAIWAAPADRIAVDAPDGVITYGGLLAAASALAERLVEHSGPVAVVLPRGARAIVAIVACVLAGRPFHPCPPSIATRDRLEAAGVTDVVPAEAAPVSWPSERTLPVTIVREDGPLGDPRRSLSPGPEPAYLVSTSGTTGEAKIVRGSGRALARYLRWQRDELTLTGVDVMSNTADPWFDFSYKETLGALVAGAKVVVVDDSALVHGRALLMWLAKHRPTMLCLLPSRLTGLTEAMAKYPVAAAAATDRLRLLLVSGEPFPRDLYDRWRVVAPGPAVLNLYGPTESTVIKLRHLVGELPPDSRTVPVGTPIPGTRVELVPRTDVDGEELCIISEDLALGYLDTEGGGTVFDRAADGTPRLRTGDLARRTSNGLIELLGRADHVVKRRGVKVSLPTVEAAALRVAEVTHAAALQVPGDPDGRVILCYQSSTGAPLPGRALRAALLDELPLEQLPDRVTAVPSWPLCQRGKTDRGALLALAVSAEAQ